MPNVHEYRFQRRLDHKPKMSREALARAIGVSYVTLWRWETGITLPSDEDVKSWDESHKTLSRKLRRKEAQVAR